MSYNLCKKCGHPWGCINRTIYQCACVDGKADVFTVAGDSFETELERELEDLEKTDPEVRKGRENYDRAVKNILSLPKKEK